MGLYLLRLDRLSPSCLKCFRYICMYAFTLSFITSCYFPTSSLSYVFPVFVFHSFFLCSTLSLLRYPLFLLCPLCFSCCAALFHGFFFTPSLSSYFLLIFPSFFLLLLCFPSLFSLSSVLSFITISFSPLRLASSVSFLFTSSVPPSFLLLFISLFLVVLCPLLLTLFLLSLSC